MKQHKITKKDLAVFAENHSEPPRAGWELRTPADVDEFGRNDQGGYHKTYPCGSWAKVYRAAAGNWVSSVHRKNDWFNSIAFAAHDPALTFDEVLAFCDDAAFEHNATKQRNARDDAALVARLKAVETTSHRQSKTMEDIVARLEEKAAKDARP